jgi:hypothetical protein
MPPSCIHRMGKSVGQECAFQTRIFDLILIVSNSAQNWAMKQVKCIERLYDRKMNQNVN